MRATRSTRSTARRRTAARRKPAAARPAKAAAKPVKAPPAPPPQVMFRICRPGWAVIVEKVANATATRIVCPFCTKSHLVPGPVRGFRKMRRAQWIKLRRVSE
ncbi:MAG TPA: hypothetical protein VGA40_10875 [Candidatus Acidoferrales bacterium]